MFLKCALYFQLLLKTLCTTINFNTSIFFNKFLKSLDFNCKFISIIVFYIEFTIIFIFKSRNSGVYLSIHLI